MMDRRVATGETCAAAAAVTASSLCSCRQERRSPIGPVHWSPVHWPERCADRRVDSGWGGSQKTIVQVEQNAARDVTWWRTGQYQPPTVRPLLISSAVAQPGWGRQIISFSVFTYLLLFQSGSINRRRRRRDAKAVVHSRMFLETRLIRVSAGFWWHSLYRFGTKTVSARWHQIDVSGRRPCRQSAGATLLSVRNAIKMSAGRRNASWSVCIHRRQSQSWLISINMCWIRASTKTTSQR